MRLHSTAAGRAVPFAPADGRTVTMYVCGPTVYAEPHLGHARSALVYDTLRRRFRQKGWRVKHAMNFTDMAEEIAHRASLEGRTIRDTARKYATLYLRDTAGLRVLRPTHLTWASKFVPRMVEDIQALLDQGLAYEQDGSVYFDTVKGHPLGMVSRVAFHDVTAGEAPRTGRKDPGDFVLWRNSHDWGECWIAPWSCGRPGWHNQCSAMALRTLGPTLDLHGGGVDLAFPHHDSEAAVAQALTGKPLARHWLHNGHVTVWKEKMSKSRGNFVLAREATRRHGPDAVRLFLLSARYRDTLDYDPKAMRSWASLARTHHKALQAAARHAGRARPSVDWDPWRAEFAAALDDDLDTPRAMGLLREAAPRIARSPGKGADAAAAARALREASWALGLDARIQP
ncbi:MAG TPA: class I tRNA ligase family protein [Candidatus Thermoplasmatota archaeon]|nr:class I tRNA ligase family protein [Candidatus Thermoplasmatota archaeon]